MQIGQINHPLEGAEKLTGMGYRELRRHLAKELEPFWWGENDLSKDVMTGRLLEPVTAAPHNCSFSHYKAVEKISYEIFTPRTSQPVATGGL